MRDDVVSVDYGWWHPEWGADEPSSAAMESTSNANHLTRCEVGEPMIGSVVVQRHSVRPAAL